ncbi:hypothetical protein ACWEUT_24225, partial [Actinomadura geliboluensis]
PGDLAVLDRGRFRILVQRPGPAIGPPAPVAFNTPVSFETPPAFAPPAADARVSYEARVSYDAQVSSEGTADSPVSFDPPGRANGRTRPLDEDPEPAAVEDSEVTGRLPRRVRQRNLAPQLRKRPLNGRPKEAAPADEDFEEPSPELSRDLMASLQSGWLRGRIADDEPGDLEPRDEWGEA